MAAIELIYSWYDVLKTQAVHPSVECVWEHNHLFSILVMRNKREALRTPCGFLLKKKFDGWTKII